MITSIRTPVERKRRTSIYLATDLALLGRNISPLGAERVNDQYQCLRNFLRIPRESRIWGSVELKDSAKESAEFLSRLELLDRLSEDVLQKILMACELVIMRKQQSMFTQGQLQTECFMLLSGNVSIKKEKSSENDEEQTAEYPILGPGDTVGMQHLFTEWGRWSLTGTITSSKAEVVVFKKWDAMRISSALWVGFDSRSAVEEIRMSMSSARPISAVYLPRQEVASNRSVESVRAVESGFPKLRKIPFFRQFEPEFLDSLAPSVRIYSSIRRAILFQTFHRSAELQNKMMESSSNFVSCLHVITSGRVWIFHRSVKDAFRLPASGDKVDETRENVPIEQLWEKSDDFCHTFGTFYDLLPAGNALFGASLPVDCTVITEPGTCIIQVLHWNQHISERRDPFVYQIEKIRKILITPSITRLPSERSFVLSLLQNGLTFFKHITPKHAARLLETCTLRRFFPGEAVIRKGDVALRLYIILNGFAVERTEDHSQISPFWCIASERSKVTSFFQQYCECKVGVGETIGEREVIESTEYTTTMIAAEEIEAIEIEQNMYETVLWDLCDGEAVPVHLIKEILEVPPSERSSSQINDLIELLQSSDFLSQFPRELRRHITATMVIVEFGPKSLVVREGEPGEDMYIIISGSVALHTLATHGHNHNVNQSFSHTVTSLHSTHDGRGELSNYGLCKRVLGIGDSFGETVFLQNRVHPASAVTRTESVMILIQRQLLSPNIWHKLAEFVGNPPAEAMNAVFEKDLEDRNENDIMLLVNTLSENPFLHPMSHSGLTECAQVVLRASQQKTDADSSQEQLQVSEEMIYFVNRGSLLARPLDVSQPIFINFSILNSQNLADTPKTKQPRAQTKQKNRGHHLSSWIQNETQFYGLFVVIKVQEKTDTNLLNSAVRILSKYSVVTIDSNGMIMSMTEQETDDIGLINDIYKCWRRNIPGFRFGLAIAIGSETIIFASNSMKDGKRLTDSLFSNSIFLQEHFKRSNIVKSGQVWLKIGYDIKSLIFRLSEDAVLSYCAQREHITDNDWYAVCKLTDCLNICLLPAKDGEKTGLELILAPMTYACTQNGKVTLFFQSQRERDQWADVFCLSLSSEAQRRVFGAEFVFSHEYEDAVRKIQVAAVKFLKRIRDNREQALQRLLAIGTKGDKSHESDKSFHQQPSIFIGFGSAFSFNGTCLVNQASETLCIPTADWIYIEKRETARQVEALIHFLEKVPSLKHANRKDLLMLSSSASTSRHFAGAILSGSDFSDRHTILIRDGACALGRISKKGSKSARNRPNELDESSTASRVKCLDCNGMGSVQTSAMKITEKVHVCSVCNGHGYIEDPILHNPACEVILLHPGAVLSEHFKFNDHISNFQLHVKSQLTLVYLKKEIWDEVKDKRVGTEASKLAAAASAAAAVDFGTQLYLKSQTVLKSMERKHHKVDDLESASEMLRRQGKQRPVHSPSVDLSVNPPKYRSKEMKKITALLAQKPVRYQDTENSSLPHTTTRTQAVSMPPPSTIRNKFATDRPQYKFSQISDSELRSTILNNVLQLNREKEPLNIVLPTISIQARRSDKVENMTCNLFEGGNHSSRLSKVATTQGQVEHLSMLMEILRNLGRPNMFQHFFGDLRPRAEVKNPYRTSNLFHPLTEWFAQHAQGESGGPAIRLEDFLQELREHRLVNDSDVTRSPQVNGIEASIESAEAARAFREAAGVETTTNATLGIAGLCAALLGVLGRLRPSALSAGQPCPEPASTVMTESVDCTPRLPTSVATGAVGSPLQLQSDKRQKASQLTPRPPITPRTGGTIPSIMDGSPNGKGTPRRDRWRSPFIERSGLGVVFPRDLILLPVKRV